MPALLKQWWNAFTHPVNWELERYLAGSSDRADLEHRMRQWEQRRRPSL